MEQIDLFNLEDYDLMNTDGKTKTCSKCKKALPLKAFSISSGANFLRPECKKCNNELAKVRDKLKLKHGMPSDGYNCPICTRGEDEVAGKGNWKNGSWVLDHCHDTHTFRGWLCHSCNRALGGFNDSVITLERAIQYLKNHKEKL